MIVRCQG